eukprot:g24315.t1
MTSAPFTSFGTTRELDYWPQDDLRIFKEIGAAFTASVLVSPIVAIIDKSLVKDIEGIASLSRSMAKGFTKMIFEPRAFFGGPAFLYTCAVYFGTYTAANLSMVGIDYYRVSDQEKRKTTRVTFATAANVSLLAWRDAQFAKMFLTEGQPQKPRPVVPKSTLGLFVLRDASTMMATFYGAPSAAKYLQDKHDWSKGFSEASILCPVRASLGLRSVWLGYSKKCPRFASHAGCGFYRPSASALSPTAGCGSPSSARTLARVKSWARSTKATWRARPSKDGRKDGSGRFITRATRRVFKCPGFVSQIQQQEKSDLVRGRLTVPAARLGCCSLQ